MVDQPSLDSIQSLYDRGLYLPAYRASESLGPLTSWRGAAARVLAGRLAGGLGATRLARVIHSLAWREHPDDWHVRYFAVWAILQRRGPWAARSLVLSLGEPAESEDNERRSDWFAMRGHLHALFRDFSRAHRDSDRALEIAPTRAWAWVERGNVLEREDRHDEALTAYEKALELRPWYRPAVEAYSYALIHANRLDDALRFLTDASERLEAWSVFAHLSGLHTEREEHEPARVHAQRLIEFMPLLAYDKMQRQWLYSRLSDAAYYCGDYPAAIEWAEKSETPFLVAIAERLKEPAPGKPLVQLPVGYVRQHHLTCAPATLTAISQYWSRPADHLEVTEAICYDGTPAHSERTWAVEQGYVTREFRVTWDTSLALLDAGIPFTLTTVEPGNAHLQAVIGYDRYRGTLLIRDPSARGISEFRAELMLKRYESSGPRGMLMVPPERADVLADIPLPDADLYDRCYDMELALRGHRRADAAAQLAQLERDAPDHRLTAQAARSLAWYDANIVQGNSAVDRLRAMYPDDTNLQLAKVSLLRDLGRRDERMALLAPAADSREAHPLMMLEYARDLSADARENPQVRALLRRILWYRPLEASAVALLADIEWSEERHAEALEMYRLTSCLEDKDERFARSYFAAARHLGRTEEALDFLRDRVQRYQRRNFWPARTLASAYEQLERTTDAQAVYDEALAHHAENGTLLLMAARFCIANGFLERASLLLAQAQPRAARADWLRTAAAHARAQADLAGALGHWRELLEIEPLAADANEIVPDLISALEGEPAAHEHVRQVAERFPFNETVRQVRIQWARRLSAEAAEEQLRGMLTADPNDVWARRELASVYLDEARWNEALGEAQLALELDPTAPVSHYLIGRAYECLDDRAAAQLWFQKSLALSVDYIQPFLGLLRIADTRRERVEALEFVAQELARQVTYGDGMLNYRYYAEGTLTPEEILKLMREAHASRPDLWQSWSALILQLVKCGEYDEAYQTSETALRRFPLQPRLWLDRAEVLELLGDTANQIVCVRKALEIAPGWNTAEHQLADLLEREGQTDEVRAVLETALRHDPLDATSHIRLAQFLWAQQQQAEAVERLQHAVRIDPGREQGWNLLRRWSHELENPDVALAPARRLVDERPQEARSWMVLAEVLGTQKQYAECVEALDCALERNPRNEDAHSLKAYYLAKLERFEDALAACRPPIFGDSPPIMLRSRKAEVNALRGDRNTAIELMKEVVHDDPDYAWAWQRLVEWYDELNFGVEYVEAARQIVRLDANDPVGYGYLGDALLRVGNAEEAEDVLRRAIAKAPEYSYGIRRLCDFYLDKTRWADLLQLAQQSGAHLPPGFGRAYWAQALIGLGRSAEVPEVLEALSAEAGLSDEAIELGFRGTQDNAIRPKVAQILEQRLAQPDAAARLAFVWGRLAVMEYSQNELVSRLSRVAVEPERQVQSLLGCIEQVAENDDPKRLNELRNDPRLRLNERYETWSAMGRCLLAINQLQAAAAWLADWPQRPDRQSCDLYFMALTLLATERWAEAAETHHQGLALAPDWTKSGHNFGLCLLDVWEGRFDAAASRLKPFAEECWNLHQEGLVALLRVFLAAHGRSEDGVRIDFREALRGLDAAQARAPKSALLKYAVTRSRVILLKQLGHPLRAMYYAWKLRLEKWL